MRDLKGKLFRTAGPLTAKVRRLVDVYTLGIMRPVAP